MLVNDEYYMQLALELAEKTSGQTGVNPVVGCVLVHSGRIVGVGAHLRRGEGHAEIHALRMAGEQAAGATAYVTLEPCSHEGLTPPCASALIRAGVRKVFIAALDPNPLVAGRGLEMLRQNGIETDLGLGAERANLQNEAFFKYIRTGLPFVAVKTASTLDGKLATDSGDSRWVSGEAAREMVHTLRHKYMAIMVGIGTVLADDPSLTARGPVNLIQPVRIIVDSQLRTPLTAKVVTDAIAPTVILTSERADEYKRRQLEQAGIQVLTCGADERVHLPIAMKRLAELQLSSVLLEGGGTLNGAMLAAGLLDKAYLFIAPKIVGGSGVNLNFTFTGSERMSDAVTLRDVRYETVGQDLLVSGYFPKETEG